MAFPLIIFTDLDGTLLDHHTYSARGAADTLQRLHQLAVPVIMTSSKTRAEIQRLQDRLGLREPFITENGGGVFFPPGHPVYNISNLQQTGAYRYITLGRPYSEIREIFKKISHEFKLKGFGDMTVDEIVEYTGLSIDEASLAQQRNFTEPFLFLADPQPQDLKKKVATYGLTITRGGRFYHLMAAGQDKGRAVTETAKLYKSASNTRIVTVGLGDAENDYTMLKVVDIPVLIPKPDGSYTDMSLHNLRRAPYPGSRGWGTAVTQIVDDLQLNGTVMDIIDCSETPRPLHKT